MKTDPWKSISQPSLAGDFRSRRVDVGHPYDFWWSRDHEGRCLLLLRCESTKIPKSQRPRLKGVEVHIVDDFNKASALMVRLLDPEHRELFHTLCLDIIEATRSAPDVLSAARAAVDRTWRWHRLLRGGQSGRLAPHEQKGLLGELHFLRTALLTRVSPADAIRSWQGPGGAPKDFDLGAVAVEVKARRGSSRPFVRISSEHQLDGTGLESLLLYVAGVSEVPEGQEGAFTLAEYVESVKSAVGSSPDAAMLLEEKLLEVGYDVSEDYTDIHWAFVSVSVYEVAEAFPRITSELLPSGVQDVPYSLSLSELNAFEIDNERINHLLEGVPR